MALPSLRILVFALICTAIGFAPVAHAEPAGVCEVLFQRILSPQERTAAAQNLKQRIAPGRVVSYTFVEPARPDLPVFLLLPGMNRAMLVTDPGAQALIHRGFGVASLTFSVQPHSVAALDSSEAPSFLKQQPTMTDLAAEVRAVSDHLLGQHNASSVIPVSLSFSGSVSPYLQGFPLVIDTAPMTDEGAAAPEGPKARSMIRATQVFNPIFGSMVSRMAIDSAYDLKWRGQVENMLKLFPELPAARKTDFVKGYSAMSRITEDKSWSKAPPTPSGVRRVMILGSEESPLLLINQLEAFQTIHKTHPDAVLAVVMTAGHYVPAASPVMYGTLLELAWRGEFMKEGGMVLLTPPTDQSEAKVTAIPGAELDRMIGNLIETLRKQLEKAK